jgi:FMN phosphatase YigB (HAD superfamily)
LDHQVSRRISTVFFDLGETLIDETRSWASWADWLGIPHLTFMAVLGATIARGEPHTNVFQLFRPGFNLHKERALRSAGGVPDVFDRSDLYPDALPCLQQLRQGGYKLGVAGNQCSHEFVSGLGLPVDFVGSSAQWGVAKPAPEFFQRIIETTGQPSEQIAYVGDRPDFDIRPARQASMAAIHIQRGPWAWIGTGQVAASEASAKIQSLQELHAALERLP